MHRVLEVLTLVVWAIPWIAGGMLLAMGVFRLRRGELAIVGFSLGLVIEIWLANLLAQLVTVPMAFWMASFGILLVGALAAGVQGNWQIPALRPWTWLALVALAFLFNAIGQGLGVFDDYQNLPTVSLMAAGDVPPHFALDPSLRFGYHYLLLLLAAQIMRLGNILPWTALDLARGLILALPLVLVAHWAYRLTGRWLVACLTCVVFALAGGTRWLLLLLPASWVARISDQITLIGSASSSAPSLAEAMISPWKIDGAGPIPFPFAFYSGVNQPYIMLYTGIAGSGVLILMLLLLTATRWQNRGGAIVTVVLMASLAIANEIAFLLVGIGIVLSALVGVALRPNRVRTRDAAMWLGVSLAALAVATMQGGMLTEVMKSGFSHSAASASYFDPTPTLVWPPGIVSAHMGALSVANPLQLLVAVLEIGSIVLVTPAVLIRGWRAIRRGHWLEAGIIASSVGLLGAMFLSFKGPLFTAAPRLLSGWLFVCSLYFVPLVWAWSAKRSDPWRMGAIAVGAAGCLGGLVLLATQLAAIQRPVYSTFITQLDASVAEDHWNQLEAGALVFDPLVYRAPTVLGRPTRSSPSWYSRSEDWERLRDSANPFELRHAGFAYMYIDGQYWEGLDPKQQERLADACIRQIGRVDGVRSETDYTKDFRLLLDIRACA
jgi:hypothetical protein